MTPTPPRSGAGHSRGDALFGCLGTLIVLVVLAWQVIALGTTVALVVVVAALVLKLFGVV